MSSSYTSQADTTNNNCTKDKRNFCTLKHTRLSDNIFINLFL